MQDAVISFIHAYWPWILACWFALFVFGTLVLYIGYGFVMAAKRAYDEGKSQRKIYLLDLTISTCFMLLDVFLNIVIYGFICLDFRFKYWFTTMSVRFSMYDLDDNEWIYRKYVASVFAAGLDGKDPSGDHILGKNIYFKWLD